MDIPNKEEGLKTLARLKAAEKANRHKRWWTEAEVRKIAPWYEGPAEKFCIKKCIRLYKYKMRMFQDEEEVEVSLRQAVMQIFHEACPHPVRYRDADNHLDIISFEEDLQLWLIGVVATWECMYDSEHNSNCTCCLSFDTLATNYDDMFERLMTVDVISKRVSKVQIIQWADMINRCDEAEVPNPLRDMINALMNQRPHPCVVSDSENDSDDDSFGVQSEEMGTNQRGRKVSKFCPLEHTVVSRHNDILHVTATFIKKTLKIDLRGLDSGTQMWLNKYSEKYVKAFIRTTQLFSIIKMRTHRERIDDCMARAQDFTRLMTTLNHTLSDTQSQYSARGAKRQRTSTGMHYW